MFKNIKIPDAIGSRTDYKRKFSLWELYRAYVSVPGAIAKMIGNKRSKSVDQQFVERLQLAVTEVNGCAACSYAHSYIALKKGMNNEEINSFLNGDGKFIKPEEAKALLFAQHFADSGGYPKKEAYDSILREYGHKKANIILSAVQLMIAGNIYGIPYSAFLSRLKGKPYRDSSLIYETGMLVAGIICMPIAMVHGIIKSLIGLSNIKLNHETLDDNKINY